MSVRVRRLDSDPAGSVTAKSVQTNAVAYAHYNEGLREANRMAPECHARAIALFKQALAADSTFASAHAAIAESHIYQAIRGYAMPRDALREGRNACDVALAIDPQLVSAVSARAWFVGLIERDIDTALNSLQHALNSDPHYAHGHCYHAWILRSAGRLDDAVAAARRGFDTDPHSLLTSHVLAWTHFMAGNVAAALKIERTFRFERPHLDLPHVYVAVFAAYAGYSNEAREACDDAIRLCSNDSTLMAAIAYVLARTGRHEIARTMMAGCEGASFPRVPRPLLAPAVLALGEHGRAIELLRQARDEACVWFPGARFDPRLAELSTRSSFQSVFG